MVKTKPGVKKDLEFYTIHETSKTVKVRTALVALITFMPTNPDGALGSLDYKKEERRKLAIKSRESSPKFGTAERQKLIDEIHEYMLSKATPVPQVDPKQTSDEISKNQENENQVGAQQSDDAITAIEEHPNPEGDDRVVYCGGQSSSQTSR